MKISKLINIAKSILILSAFLISSANAELYSCKSIESDQDMITDNPSKDGFSNCKKLELKNAKYKQVPSEEFYSKNKKATDTKKSLAKEEKPDIEKQKNDKSNIDQEDIKSLADSKSKEVSTIDKAENKKERKEKNAKEIKTTEKKTTEKKTTGKKTAGKDLNRSTESDLAEIDDNIHENINGEIKKSSDKNKIKEEPSTNKKRKATPFNPNEDSKSDKKSKKKR